MKIFSFIMYMLAAILASSSSRSEVIASTPEDDDIRKAAEIAKIYYLVEMTVGNASELVQSIDRLNENYKSLKKIYVYINSYGGDLDAGKMAYWAIKSSQTPVTVVNLSMVASAASVMFCGAEERLSLRGGTFLLHPPSTWVDAAYIQPDRLNAAQELLNAYRDSIADIYRECLSVSGEEIEKLLYSENDRLVLSPAQARETGLVTGLENSIVDAPVSIVIKDSEQGQN
ncbi:ATP-dependent Clp protease proteolytic subunit [Chelativorans salis]|uniref:ATP-dependent Clp protease proteolytic subunit n=1 Tax=Chelativorans salis TaxID=2978478 RepID=A0ABT2LLQ4_9HYPH|nr:ATP-dependent Clp protease proteolytic subunit [Chelativorans sp. EGI FJ00035]MCT7375226.1 ATP-dependent Clp protease proteolytic subunit [Chelativorans sp. EGI FJ00035]